jgi:hypothetical protein
VFIPEAIASSSSKEIKNNFWNISIIEIPTTMAIEVIMYKSEVVTVVILPKSKLTRLKLKLDPLIIIIEIANDPDKNMARIDS